MTGWPRALIEVFNVWCARRHSMLARWRQTGGVFRFVYRLTTMIRYNKTVLSSLHAIARLYVRQSHGWISQLFSRISHNVTHVLKPLLPTNTQHSYNLRDRRHNFEKKSQINRRHFIIRQLYKYSYWLHVWFLADRTNGRAIATLLRLSVVCLWRYVLWLNGAS